MVVIVLFPVSWHVLEELDKSPPDAATLKSILKLLELSALEILRKNEEPV